MDIIIPYTHDPHNGTELCYALRSIEAHLTGFNDVIIIGTPPKWHKGRSIYCDDVQGRKEASIMQKVLKAALSPEVSKDFIMWHDDHFLLQPLNVSDIKYWYDKNLEDALLNNAKGYGETIRNTVSRLLCATKNFDIHMPIIFNSDQFIDLMIQGWKQEYCLKSLYCNTLQIEGEQMEDMKINTPYTVPEIKSRIDDRVFFSSGPLSLVGQMIEVLQELYPHYSRWEK